MDKILLNDIQGAQWIFQCDGKGRLCYSTNGAPKQILQADMGGGFDIITDGVGHFHLVLQSTDGSLIYLTYDFTNWKKYVILKSKSNRSIMSRFKMFSVENRIHCFYVLTINDKSMLVHHVFSPTEQSATPQVIDYVDSAKSISIAADGKGALHIFFFDASGKFNYKLLRRGKAEDCRLETEDDIKSVCCICDDAIHLLYTAKIKNYYTLIYYSLSAKERKIISFSDSNISEIHIFTKGKNLFLQWRERTRCYQCTSSDGGNSFKKPVHITEGRGRRTETVGIRGEQNPLCHGADRCIALTDGERINPMNAAEIKPISRTVRNTSKENSYNIIDGEYSDRLKQMQSKIRENEKELVRLNTIISSLSEKISAIAKSAAASPPPVQQMRTGDSGDIGDINEENYKLFNNTDIDDVEFDNIKTFE